MNRLCSGLPSVGTACCERRGECANYVHWIDDPRSEFNICTVTGKPFKHYVPRGIPVSSVPVQHGQGNLF